MKRFRLRFLLGSLCLLTPFMPLSAQDPEGDAPILHNGLIREFILSDLNITLPVPDGTTPVLDNGKVRAVFGSGKTFSLDELVMNGRSLADKGSSPSPWLISCLGPNGEKFNFTPGHAWYTGARKVREGTVSKLIFSWPGRLVHHQDGVPETVPPPSREGQGDYDQRLGRGESADLRSDPFRVSDHDRLDAVRHGL